MKRSREVKPKTTIKFDHVEKSSLYSLEDKQSWVLSTTMEKVERPTKEEMTTLWEMQPEERPEIMMYGQLTKTPRYTQTYSNDNKGYRFSGVTHEAKPFPPIVAKYMAYANKICETMLLNDYDGRTFNMALLNWYEDGKHYIGYHSDDETQLYKNNRQETLVFSISFGQKRKFQVQRKDKDKEFNEDVLNIDLTDCCALVMGGKCQTNYKHGVPPVKGKAIINKRLNLTFRIFK
jgi:alkylated DNA repair dioxygenase AlkB